MYRLVWHTNICTCGFTLVCTLTYVQVGKAHKYTYMWFYKSMYTYICTGWYGTQIYVHVVLQFYVHLHMYRLVRHTNIFQGVEIQQIILFV